MMLITVWDGSRAMLMSISRKSPHSLSGYDNFLQILPFRLDVSACLNILFRTLTSRSKNFARDVNLSRGLYSFKTGR